MYLLRFQSIKAACEVGSLGDLLSPSVLAAADDLFHMRIPETWRQMAGQTAPPPGHSLANWLVDLTARCQHFERILVHVSAYFISFSRKKGNNFIWTFQSKAIEIRSSSITTIFKGTQKNTTTDWSIRYLINRLSNFWVSPRIVLVFLCPISTVYYYTVCQISTILSSNALNLLKTDWVTVIM